jgi:hypothetical protein
MDSLDAPSRLDTAHPGHFHVHNDDLGIELACHLDGRVTIYRFAYYRKISAATKEYAERLTEGTKVIDQENTKWFRHTRP